MMPGTDKGIKSAWLCLHEPRTQYSRIAQVSGAFFLEISWQVHCEVRLLYVMTEGFVIIELVGYNLTSRPLH